MATELKTTAEEQKELPATETPATETKELIPEQFSPAMKAFMQEQINAAVKAALAANVQPQPYVVALDPNMPQPYDEANVLKKPVAFFAYNIATVLGKMAKRPNGSEVRHPYNRDVVFVHEYSDFKKISGKDTFTTQISVYLCHDKLELEWLKLHPDYGVAFRELSSDAYTVDDENFMEQMQASERVKGMSDVQVRMRYEQEFKTLLKDVQMMRVKLIPVLSKEIKEAEAIETKRRLTTIMNAEKLKEQKGFKVLGG